MFRACKGCAAKDDTIRLLKEQVEQLWTHVGTPQLKRTSPPEPEFELVEAAYVSDEELDIEHMRKHGLISEDAARAALEGVGAMNTTFEYS